jgi:hypothetical protein
MEENRIRRYPLIYVAGKYIADNVYEIRKNIRLAEDVGAKLLKMGFMVVIPHKNTGLMDGIIPNEEFVLRDLEIVRRCDAICMLENWTESKGAQMEYEFAKNHGIRTFHESELNDDKFYDNFLILHVKDILNNRANND